MIGPSWSQWRGAPLAWALYDFAYSIFAFLLMVRFFPTWVINDLGRPDWYVSVTQFVVVVIVVVAMPLAGALADQLGRRRPLLAVFTLVACAASAVLGVLPSGGSILPLLVVAGIGVLFAQLAFAQYDPLLADVAPPGARGRVSGLAVALGFAGTIIALVVVAELVVGDGNKQRAFAPAGLLFLVFALPALLLIRERARPPAETSGGVTRAAFAQFARSVLEVRRHPHAARFLVGRFLYADAIATLSAFLTVYMTRLGGFSESEKNLVVGLAVLAAAGGAIAAGRLVEWHGPKRPLLFVLPVFAGGVFLTAGIGQPWTVWVAGPIVGVALGFVWTADRVFMLRLAPEELRGQFFGFFNLASRLASAFGPLLIWSGTVWVLHQRTGWVSALDASRAALAGLALAALLGWAVIRPVSDERAAGEADASEHAFAAAPARGPAGGG
ncbi:MAG: MFS transporter [Thermoleophilia bacterium]|nr:MFS transporter [Thermoleophilia bacterium]